MINAFVFSFSVFNNFKKSSVPCESKELSNTSSSISILVLTEFFNLATARHVNNNAKGQFSSSHLVKSYHT